MTLFIKRIVPIFIFSLFFIFHSANVFAENSEYILVFEEFADILSLETYESIEIIEEFTFFPGVVVLADPDVIKEVELWPSLISVEKNQEFTVEASSSNWGISHLGIPASWDLGYKGKGVKVAVIDSGIATDHPALQVAGGVSMVDYTSSYRDDNGHGTHSAGIIAAQTGSNHLGVAPSVELFSVKSLDSSGNGKLNDTIRGIEWAVQNQMSIINLSLGTTSHSAALQAAVDHAFNQNVIVVAAAGNKKENEKGTKPVEYPAKYSSVVAVSAVDPRNRIASFSATGPEVEFAAPGTQIYSTYLNGRYVNMSGTSMAAPFVSGVFALYREAFPSLHARDIRKMVQAEAFKLTTSTRDDRFGFGLIQPPKYVELSAPSSLSGKVISKKSDGTITHALNWSHNQKDRVDSYSVYRNGKKVATVQQTAFEEVLAPGEYHYTVSAIGKDGTETKKSSTYSVKVEKASEPTPVPTPGPSPEEPIRGKEFTDVSSQFWASSSIYYLADLHIIGGYADGTFQPSASVRRGQAVAMIARALKWNNKQDGTAFSDVDHDYFASGDIAYAVELGILSGFADGTFRPNAPITRAQMAAILSKAFELGRDSGFPFSDVTNQTTGYREISQLEKMGIVSGYENGTLYQPNASLTRAQFSVILSRVLNEDFRIQ